jgi:hypothetical protein
MGEVLSQPSSARPAVRVLRDLVAGRLALALLGSKGRGEKALGHGGEAWSRL